MKKKIYLALSMLPVFVATLPTYSQAASQQSFVDEYEDEFEEDFFDDEVDTNFTVAEHDMNMEQDAKGTSSEEKQKIDNSYPGMNRQNSVYTGQPFPKDSYHISVFGDFLYLSSTVTDLAWASFKTTGLNTSRTIKTFDRHYTPAFRIGGDYSTSAQGWSFGLDWMRLQQSQEKKAHYPYNGGRQAAVIYSASNSEAFGANQAGGEVEGKQNLHFDEVNLMLSKEIFFSKYFSFRPTGSGTFVWYKHDFWNQYGQEGDTPSLYNKIHYKNEFHGFGFKFGSVGKLQLGYGFYILGDGQFGVIYGPRNLTKNSSDSLGFTNKVTMNSDIFEPMIEAKMDLGWRRSFCHEKFGLDIYIGYEYHNYFNAIITPSRSEFDFSDDILLNQRDDLGIQGMNFGIRLNF
jgi:hypothetical protein